MFEEEQDNKIYNLIITQGIDEENQYKFFTERLYSKPEFLWTESYAQDYSLFGENFFSKVDIIVVLSGIYKDNKENIDNLIKKSEEFDIPMILVRPYGMELVPENLEEKATSVVGWNANCIVDAIKTIVKGEFDWESPCDTMGSE